ncbi:MAG: hypothetical protein JWP89_2620 [Schlesneria sp.]|nr:hypothetical protein [Schlesneria sp.]
MNEDGPLFQDFGGSEQLLAFIKERSDDIEKVVIPQMANLAITRSGIPVAETDKVGMIIHMISHRFLIVPSDAELLLNDGILNRMNIKIELWHPNKI